MKAGIIAFFLCYLALPPAFYGGIGLLEHKAVGLLPLLYYGLLVFALARCSRLPGPSRHFYRLALAVVGVHLLFLGVMNLPEVPSSYRTKELALAGLLLCIPGVYAIACLAGATLAWERRLFLHSLLQMAGPGYMLVHWNTPSLNQSSWSFLPLIFAFFGQGAHACWLGLGRIRPPQAPISNEVGFSPA